MNKRIVFLRSNPVSPDSRVEKEVNSIIGAGNFVCVVCWERNKKHKQKKERLHLKNSAADIYRIGIPANYGGGIKANFVPLLRFQIFLVRWLFKHRNEYDIIHACDFDTALTAYICSRLLNKKLVYDIFDYYVHSFRVPAFLTRVIEKMDRRIINSADAVIICTKQRKEQIAGTSPKKLTVIHNSPEYRAFDEKIANKDTIKIVYVGILTPERFIREIADFVIKNTNYEFHIGGFGGLEEYFIKLSQKHKNIFFYGKLSYEKTLELENSCDIITAIYDPSVPNHYFAAPNKFYEALMLGKPVVMARGTGMSDLVLKHDIGVLMDYNPEDLARAFEKIVSRKSEWSKMANRMKAIYNESFSWREMEKRLISLYNDIT